ncbi:hypothetical protein D6D27_09542 [Aureobasidium pullulans]|nr:hypothetical protein D6D27_09542 [Aureobasidium pullulans]
MVSDSSRTRAPIWDSPATEVLAYDLLEGIWETDVILCCHELRVSQLSELTLCDPQVKTHKNALIRYANGRWEAFTYFKQDVSEISVDKLKLTSALSLASITRDPFATHQDNDTSDTD